jgi:fumarylacetoacetase
VGDVSGTEPEKYGSMPELRWNGAKPVQLPDGSKRRYIEDDDVVIIKGYGLKDGIRIGFGEMKTEILPATK